MPHSAALRTTPVGDIDSFRPSRQRPVRVRSRAMPADTHFEPHSHAWSQLAYCASGILQVCAEQGAAAGDEITYIVPPSRAVWIAPGARHTSTCWRTRNSARSTSMPPSRHPAGAVPGDRGVTPAARIDPGTRRGTAACKSA
jgi:hypothetical protein